MWPFVLFCFCSCVETEWFPTVWVVTAGRAHLTSEILLSVFPLQLVDGPWLGQMFLPRSDQVLVVQRSKARGESVLVAKVPLAESGIQYQRGQLHCSLSSSGGSTVPPKQLWGHGIWAVVLAVQLPPCPSTFTNPISLAFPVTPRALNNLSLNSFSVSVSQSGFLWFVTKNLTGMEKNKGFESSRCRVREGTGHVRTVTGFPQAGLRALHGEHRKRQSETRMRTRQQKAPRVSVLA